MTQTKATIREIAKGMFDPDGLQMQRLELLGKRYCEKTVKQKAQMLSLIVQEFGKYSLRTFSETKVVAYLCDLKSERSNSWKNRYLEVFKELYDEYSWRTGKKISRPAFPRFSNVSKKADVFSTSELNELFKKNYWRNDAEFLLFYLIANCGLRLGEARGLQVRQFFMHRNFVVIDGFIRSDGSRTNFNKCGSEADSKIRVVLLPEKCRKLVETYIKKHKLKKNDFLFSRNMKPYRQEFCEKIFRRQLSNAGIKKGKRKLTPHSLRYTYVTRMRRFADAETVRKLVGHSSQMMTDYYTRPLVDDLCAGVQQAQSAVEMLFK